MLPPVAGETAVVNRYWVVKLAVYVASADGATLCEMAPPSFQLVHAICVPVPVA